MSWRCSLLQSITQSCWLLVLSAAFLFLLPVPVVVSTAPLTARVAVGFPVVLGRVFSGRLTSSLRVPELLEVLMVYAVPSPRAGAVVGICSALLLDFLGLVSGLLVVVPTLLLELELGCEVPGPDEVVLGLLLELELGVRVRPAESWITP